VFDGTYVLPVTTWDASKRPAAALLPLSEMLSPKTTKVL